MAKIVKTKSGKYHTRVFCGFDARGKKIEKSITAPTIKEVKRLVALATIEEPRTYNNLTVREAYERYIDSKANTLSPKTLKEYRAAVERDFPLLLNLRLYQIKNEMIQTAVNEISATCSPKTVLTLKPVHANRTRRNALSFPLMTLWMISMLIE